MKKLAPVILFVVAMHYVFLAAFTTKVNLLSSFALIALVLIGAVTLWAFMPEDEE